MGINDNRMEPNNYRHESMKNKGIWEHTIGDLGKPFASKWHTTMYELYSCCTYISKKLKIC